MGQPLEPRVIRSGPYIPTEPRTGDSDQVIFRKNNLITRGRESRLYEEVFSGLGNLDENLDMVALTGTLNLIDGDTTITGSGTLFYSECHLGQKICAIIGNQSWLLVPRRIISDTSMVVWRAPDTTITGVTGWRMPRLTN